jgi:hypothetical protein
MKSRPNTVRAILTDAHFWVPVIMLGLGIMLLASLK